jgi:glycosyltransferase involved in cell wall biosynthesis
LPEVVGDAAVLVDPKDYAQVAENIIKVLDESFDRDSLCEKGRINAQRFNWNKTGQAYRKVLLDK